MIRLNVFIQVEEKNQSELLGMVKELVELSQAENGCIAYDVFESSTRFDVMMICETWKDNETLIAHTQSEHSCQRFTLWVSSKQRSLSFNQNDFHNGRLFCLPFFINLKH